MEIAIRNGRNIPSYTKTYGRLNLSGALTAFPIECEYLRIKSASTNALVIIYVGGADVTVLANGYELTAGESLTLASGLGQLLPANSIYFRATGDAVLFYMADS